MEQELLQELYKLITPAKIEKFDRIAAERTRHLTVAVENLFQEHNASAVMRSCDCFGIQDIHIIEKTNKFSVNREIAMGAGRWVDRHHYYDPLYPTTKCIGALKEMGYTVVATSPHSPDNSLKNLSLDKPIALLFGTERSGLSETALNLADVHVRIPMYGFTESFNISVSAAILMHTLRDRLEKEADFPWKLNDDEQVKLKIQWCKKIIRNSEIVEKGLLKRLMDGTK
ncbi:MAG: RNA methyltransferase [Brumimicrobium sp.]|nr:RNA methyltransferase [Brumimicrobium sp.]